MFPRLAPGGENLSRSVVVGVPDDPEKLRCRMLPFCSWHICWISDISPNPVLFGNWEEEEAEEEAAAEEESGWSAEGGDE